eukprot:scaffold147433_cov13-Tisochrysis_lutea.AAC.1
MTVLSGTKVKSAAESLQWPFTIQRLIQSTGSPGPADQASTATIDVQAGDESDQEAAHMKVSG